MKKVSTVLFASVLISFLFLSVFGKSVGGLGGGSELQGKKENIKQKKVAEQTHRGGEAKKQGLKIEEQPELIWERDFSNEICQVKLHKTIGPSDFPIMAVETKNNLFIFDKKGNEIKRPLPKFELKEKKENYRGFVNMSDNGEFILEGMWMPKSVCNLRYTTVKGKTLWQQKDFYGLTTVSPNGDTVVLLNMGGGKDKKGSVEFYDQSGKLLNQHSMDLSSIEMGGYAFSFSEDSNYFILRLEQWIEEKAGKMASYPVILFNKKGKLLWRKETEVRSGKTPLFQLLISAHGNLIAYSGDNCICIVNKDGKLLWKKEPYNLLYSFSDNEDLISIGEYKTFNIAKASNGEDVRPTQQGNPIISHDGAWIAIISTIFKGNEKKLTVHIARMSDKESKLVLTTGYFQPSKIKFKFSADSKYLYSVMEREKNKVAIFKIDITRFYLN